MGLDLIVEGCPKPGHEREWRQLLQRLSAMKSYRRWKLRASRRFAFLATNASAHHALDTIALQTNGSWKHEKRKHLKK